MKSEAIADRRVFLGGHYQTECLVPDSKELICDKENEWTLDGVPNEHICVLVSRRSAKLSPRHQGREGDFWLHSQRSQCSRDWIRHHTRRANQMGPSTQLKDPTEPGYRIFLNAISV
ncbi:hypothetical protein CI238_11026 [Colletotrichum incanum]|uniref:Uncharacterized protein n=1 Tax=Colletotrichum incanum TaxID=1573173 RepID=A0A167A2X1_COLIC|nr:hypothetical protein CI238_11026 [Colletotrichum incanum]